MALILHKKKDGSLRVELPFPEEHTFSDRKFLELVKQGHVLPGPNGVLLQFANAGALYDLVESEEQDQVALRLKAVV